MEGSKVDYNENQWYILFLYKILILRELTSFSKGFSLFLKILANLFLE